MSIAFCLFAIVAFGVAGLQASCGRSQERTYYSTDIYGNDLPGGGMVVYNESSCCTVCQGFQGCLAYSYGSSDRRCYPKREASNLQQNDLLLSRSYQYPACGLATVEPGVEYSGNNLPADGTGVAAATIADCCRACRNDNNCTAFTYNTANARCFKKSAVGTRSQNGNVVSYAFKNGDPYYCLNTKIFEGGIDYTGNDLIQGGVVVTTFEDCCIICSGMDGCKAVSFDVNGGKCYLKSQVGTRTQKNNFYSVYSFVPCASCSCPETIYSNTAIDSERNAGPIGRVSNTNSIDECCNFCRAATNCAVFVLSPVNGGTCELYEATADGVQAKHMEGYTLVGLADRLYKESSRTTGFRTTGIRTTGIQSTGVQTTGVQTTRILTTSVRTTGARTTGILTTSVSAATTSPSSSTCSAAVYNYNIIGYNLTAPAVVANLLACCTACQSNDRCTSYVYDKSRMCQLKMAPSDVAVVRDTYYTYGRVTRPSGQQQTTAQMTVTQSTTGRRSTGCTSPVYNRQIQGYALTSPVQVTSLANCCVLCSQNPLCTIAEYNTTVRSCVLKNPPANASPVVVQGITYAIPN